MDSHCSHDRGSGAALFDVVLVDACHSEPLAHRFVQSGASCAVGCAGDVMTRGCLVDDWIIGTGGS